MEIIFKYIGTYLVRMQDAISRPNFEEGSNENLKYWRKERVDQYRNQTMQYWVIDCSLYTWKLQYLKGILSNITK